MNLYPLYIVLGISLSVNALFFALLYVGAKEMQAEHDGEDSAFIKRFAKTRRIRHPLLRYMDTLTPEARAAFYPFARELIERMLPSDRLMLCRDIESEIEQTKAETDAALQAQERCKYEIERMKAEGEGR